MVLGQIFREVATDPQAGANGQHKHPLPQVPGGGHTEDWHCRPPTPELMLPMSRCLRSQVLKEAFSAVVVTSS